jgi:hypothetical protein
MEKKLKDYLEWRFRTNNHPKYLKYCGQWIKKSIARPALVFRERKNEAPQ